MDPKEVKDQEVELVTTDIKEGDQRKKTFKYDHALALLSKSNTKWALPADSKFAFNGNDLSVKDGKAAAPASGKQ